MEQFKTAWPLSVAIVVFVIYKTSHLALPYFWDEAWSYLTAIKAMSASGSSMSPAAIDPELYRGHPLLFYFVSSWWYSITGASIPLMRLLPLCFSICTIITFYNLISLHFKRRVATLSTLLLMIQSLFIVQSTLFLPEMLVVLLTLLAFLAYFNNQIVSLSVWLSLLLLTKESGVVAFGVIGIFSLRDLVSKRALTDVPFRSLIPLVSSALICASFFISQKAIHGWFLFPEHVAYIEFSFAEIFDKFHQYAAYVFIYAGRNVWCFGALAGLVYFFLKKGKYAKDRMRFIVLCVVFVFGYLLFSAANFYSARYMLSIIPLVLFLLVLLIDQFYESLRLVYYLLVFIAFGNSFYFLYFDRHDNDQDLGYVDAVHCHQEMTNYMEEEIPRDSRIVAEFLMKHNLGRPEYGYLKDSIPFTEVGAKITSEVRWVVLTSSGDQERFFTVIKKHNHLLRKRFEHNKSWVELYEITTAQAR